jgi:hypothetical protein
MHDHFADEVLLAGEESETMPPEERAKPAASPAATPAVPAAMPSEQESAPRPVPDDT